MGWQAIEAVQDHSKLTSEQHTGFVILMAIARYCDANGQTPNERTKAPNTETIAEKAHCTKRTVLNWLPKLETIGELTVNRNGKGRGERVLLDIANPHCIVCLTPLTGGLDTFGHVHAPRCEKHHYEPDAPIHGDDLDVLHPELLGKVKDCPRCKGEGFAFSDAERDRKCYRCKGRKKVIGVKCKTCDGSGEVEHYCKCEKCDYWGMDDCDTCNATGVEFVPISKAQS